MLLLYLCVSERNQLTAFYFGVGCQRSRQVVRSLLQIWLERLRLMRPRP